MLLRRTGTPNPTHEHADLSPPCPQLWGGEYVGLLDEQRPHHVPAPRSAGIVPGLIWRGTRLGNGRASPLLGRHQRASYLALCLVHRRAPSFYPSFPCDLPCAQGPGVLFFMIGSGLSVPLSGCL